MELDYCSDTDYTDNLKAIRSVVGPDLLDSDILRALAACGNKPDAAINYMFDTPGFLTHSVTVSRTSLGSGTRVKKEPPCEIKQEKDDGFYPEAKVKKERGSGFTPNIEVKEEQIDLDFEDQSKSLVLYNGNGGDYGSNGCLNPTPISTVRPPGLGKTSIRDQPGVNKERRMVLKEDIEVEVGDFPEEPDWLLLGRTAVNGLSTCSGKGKLVDNEIVHFKFPPSEIGRKNYNRKWGSWTTQIALSEIARFSTKRSGEIGKLPLEWARCLTPLVNTFKVKVCGRCVAAPFELSLMQDILLYVSLYIHRSVFDEGDDKSSWEIIAPSNIYASTLPLPTLFKLLNINPFKKAEFTPGEFDSRKRPVNLNGEFMESLLPPAKRGKGNSSNSNENDGEQAISESTINKLVGAVDTYNLQEMEPPSTLVCHLRPYQKQALHWMSEAEKGTVIEQSAQTLHPCWAAYKIADKRAATVYVNIFSGESTTKFPSATERPRGGILADAMGLGKTVMTIALILSKVGRENSDDGDSSSGSEDATIDSRRQTTSAYRAQSKIKAGTLIVCPMALLGQWQDELEAHSRTGSISVFVHYGGDRINDPNIIAGHDVVLTTFGVLSTAYKHNSERKGIFHQVKWYRIVLDEAHTIKNSKSLVAEAACALKSHCRWCLTGTPLQNSLEDLYSLLCFLRVQPWCTWAWWNKLIKRPYESGDERGLTLVKAILKTLMLRRTKETKDKEGRPILVLPPVDIQFVECEQAEAEGDFYDALFKKSKAKFDQFVEDGKVLNNFASILELLLRLRQCCNHPFLVMSRGDTQQCADLNKLGRRFLEVTQNTPVPAQHFFSAPSEAYVEEVVDGILRGEVNECPICFESPDDPVLTTCAHRMCHECLLASWRSSTHGPCPMCRKALRRTDLITCPSAAPFQFDMERNWKESSKVSKLIRYLDALHIGGEKSIVFSQWTTFLDLLQIALTKRGIGFLRYDGKLVQKQRETVLKEFSEGSEKRVLLMSLKAGGVGLNLTAASNVFLMDPWWNPAVEEQAIMRIHRIGQKRTVCVRRFIVKGTVEDRMQQVQARKERMISGALTDQEVRTARIEELKMLFR